MSFYSNFYIVKSNQVNEVIECNLSGYVERDNPLNDSSLIASYNYPTGLYELISEHKDLSNPIHLCFFTVTEMRDLFKEYTERYSYLYGIDYRFYCAISMFTELALALDNLPDDSLGEYLIVYTAW